MRILALLEASTVTGPAKNLFSFHREQSSAVQPVELEIVTFYRGVPDNDFIRAAAAAAIPLHRIEEGFPFDFRVLPRLRSLIRQRNPDILQTHSIKSHFLMRLSAEWKRRPWVAFHHGYTLTLPRLHVYNRLDRWSLNRPRQIVTVSQAFARQLTDQGIPPDRIEVLHNAIDSAWGDRARDPGLRSLARTQLGIGDEEKLLLIVGRLSQEKSHIQLIQALSLLPSLAPGIPVRLLIAGDGPEKPALEEAARAAGCLDRIFFVGHVPDVLPYYAAADVAVLASKTEGSPNALLEAMAAQIPVVATAVGGIVEIADHEQSALLVPPSDAHALAEALTQTLLFPQQAVLRAQRAHSVILDRYTPQHRSRILRDLYARVIRDQVRKGSE